MTANQPELLTNDEATQFIAIHCLPNPSSDGIMALGSITQLLSFPMVDNHSLALVKRLAEDQTFDNQLLVDIFSRSMVADDPFYTSYNALVIADYFNKTGLSHSLTVGEFVISVAGLSHHNGDKGNTSMHRLCAPSEIAGAVAVIRFISTMNHYKNMVKFTLLKHPESSGVSGLTVTNKYVDRLLRSNPDKFEVIRDFLHERPVDKTKKSAKPLFEYLQGEQPTALINGIL